MQGVSPVIDPKDRPTAQELAGQSQQGKSIGGKPADVCPYCGCAMFVEGTRKGETDSFRYVSCRNESCGRKFVSRQPPATLVREVNRRDVSSSGQDGIKLYGEVG